MHQLDLVLPCYNPAAGWKETIINNIRLLQLYLPDTEIFTILVNDGSSIGVKTEDFYFLKESLPNFTFISDSYNRGKGYALRKGIKETNQDFCIYTDVDFPYRIESFVQLYKALISQDTDIVVGVRDEMYYTKLTKNRTFISKFLQFINQNILGLPVYDTQCGIKGFNRKGRELFLRTGINRYLFDLEFIFLANKNPHIKLSTIPVKLRSGVNFKRMDGKILIRESVSMIKILIEKSIDSLKNVIGK